MVTNLLFGNTNAISIYMVMNILYGNAINLMKVINFLSSFNQSVNKSEGGNHIHVWKIIAETARDMQEEIVEIRGKEGKNL